VAVAAESEEHELVARNLEAREGFQITQGLLKAAGIHFRGAAAALALKVVMVVAGVAADESHHLVSAKDALRPALADEPLQIAVDRGET